MNEMIRNEETGLSTGKSLRSLVQKKKELERSSMLLIDCSFSMKSPSASGERKCDAMRAVVDALLQTHPVPLVAFGLSRSIEDDDTCDFVDTVPEPQGGTPMGAGIRFAKAHGATHIVLISDGIPTDGEDWKIATDEFGGQIDTFYIGPENAEGARLLAEIARMTGGSTGVTDLGEPLQLTGRIVALLGDGGGPAPTGPIQL